MQKSLRNLPSYTFLTAARQYQNSKRRKYVGLVDPKNYNFKAAIWESFGGMSDGAQFVLKNLAAHLKSKLGLPPDVIFKNLQQRICLVIWQSNVKLIMSRLPNSKGKSSPAFFNQ